jgi:hypothetical protein
MRDIAPAKGAEKKDNVCKREARKWSNPTN